MRLLDRIQYVSFYSTKTIEAVLIVMHPIIFLDGEEEITS